MEEKPTRQELNKGGIRLTNQTSLHSWLERGCRAVGGRLVLAGSSLAVSPFPPPTAVAEAGGVECREGVAV